MKRSHPIILVHGGAGLRGMKSPQAACLTQALETGHGVLQSGSSALEAVEAAIRVLESSGLFNAGLGSNRQLDGARRMDASIMEGHGLRAGAVASIEGILHPISAARLVMDETAHVLLVGEPATKLAAHFNLERQAPMARTKPQVRQEELIAALSHRTLRLYREMAKSGRAARKTLGQETVGAVALDQRGTVAAGASTGGVEIMLPGRVGDTPLIGCGVYADNKSGAVSMTGLGESIIRMAVAKEITDRLADGASPAAATRAVLKKLVARIRGAAGALTLSPGGRFAIKHTTPRMIAGYWDGRKNPVVSDRFT